MITESKVVEHLSEQATPLISQGVVLAIVSLHIYVTRTKLEAQIQASVNGLRDYIKDWVHGREEDNRNRIGKLETRVTAIETVLSERKGT